jgi:hypothetical protein
MLGLERKRDPKGHLRQKTHEQRRKRRENGHLGFLVFLTLLAQL